MPRNLTDNGEVRAIQCFGCHKLQRRIRVYRAILLVGFFALPLVSIIGV